MQFYYPQVLFGLLALAIPIIVHLFQLRRFKPEPFTNVVLLKKLIISSRKSSKLKKWLSLITRLLIITSLVLAFAQPYIPNPNQKLQKKQISIFLDNSYSMSLDGDKTSLFTQAKEELLEVLPDNETYNLSTHDDSYKNLRSEDLKSLIYDIDYASNPIEINSMLKKTESLFNSLDVETENELIILSDFQGFDTDSLKLAENYNYQFIKYEPQERVNFSIDTIYLETSVNDKTLKFKVSCSEEISQNVPVSIYDNNKLLGKFILDFNDEQYKTFDFSLEQDEILNGKVSIEDTGLNYDNELYFSITKPEPINVLVISEKPTPYLDKIFNRDDFNYQQSILSKLEYEDINSADFVILNEINQIPNSLRVALENYAETSRLLCIIPGESVELSNYNNLFQKLNLSPYSKPNQNPLKLTNINFDHPIFQNVFTETVQNFDYPGFDSYYPSSNPEIALAFSNNLPLLESKGKVYRFNSTIQDNSNFQQSPLVVLSFYNMAIQARNEQKLYLENGDVFNLKLKDELPQDEVLSLSMNDYNFIPRQDINGREVKLNFKDYPNTAGHFVVTNNRKDTLNTLAFNSSRKESKLEYLELKNISGINVYSNFTDYTLKFYENYNIQSLWKWFIVLALIFMIIELLLLRFIK